jgi:hypothetical protein
VFKPNLARIELKVNGFILYENDVSKLFSGSIWPPEENARNIGKKNFNPIADYS